MFAMIQCEVCYEIHLLSSLDAIIAFSMTGDGSRESHGSRQADERNAVISTVRRVKRQEASHLAVNK
jgi:delta-aminolevulinic acid dehydratase/porphobilinogen synthase